MQQIANYCMSADVSCSACCGMYNLKFSSLQLEEWLLTNTQQFLTIELTEPNSLVEFRLKREALTLPYRIRNDIYVCPFIGYIHLEKKKTGCLLHPQGSPHPQIHLLPHPQNFSFYGESICQQYNCLAKERRLADFLDHVPKPTIYGRLICRADLLALLKEVLRRDKHFSLTQWLEENHDHLASLASTSFETPIVAEKSQDPLADIAPLLKETISN